MSRYDENEFLELLQEYRSEDTKKARRNLSMIAAIVIVAWLLRIKLTDVKAFFGIDLSKAPETTVFVLGLVLLGYWAVIFFLSWQHDSEIQKEREVSLNRKVRTLKDRLSEIEKTAEANKPNAYTPSDLGEVSHALDLYEKQKLRTANASSIGKYIGELELWIPRVLSACAFLILLSGFLKSI